MFKFDKIGIYSAMKSIPKTIQPFILFVNITATRQNIKAIKGSKNCLDRYSFDRFILKESKSKKINGDIAKKYLNTSIKKLPIFIPLLF